MMQRLQDSAWPAVDAHALGRGNSDCTGTQANDFSQRTLGKFAVSLV
jgi:hypothetical protein